MNCSSSFFYSQDMKWASKFTAEYFEILATDFYLEPSAILYCSGRGPEDGGPGVGLVKGAGASYATIGGAGKRLVLI